MALKKRRFLGWIFVVFCLYFTAHKIARRRGINETKVRLSSLKSDTGVRYVSEQSNDSVKDGDVLKDNKFTRTRTLDEKIIPAMFYEDTVNTSPHNYRYIFNPTNYCSSDKEVDADPFLIVLIASAVWEHERREIIRRTWGKESRRYDKEIKYLFFIGVDPKNKANVGPIEEFAKYGDIVQEDYLETYRNLSLKTQGQLKWATLYCSNARFVMHVDDDVVPDIMNIMKQHLSTTPNNREVSCAKVFKPKVRREGKWETSLEEYPGDQYPLSCVGWCFVAPLSIARELYHMSLNTRLLHLEDVWVTGILRTKIGDTKIRKMVGGEVTCQHLGWPKDRPTNEKILSAWKALQRDRSTRT